MRLDDKFPCKADLFVDKNINFLFGSGLSAEYIPTLKIIDDYTYETILTDEKFSDVQNYIYWDYYRHIISKCFCLQPSDEIQLKIYDSTLENYINFIKELINLIYRRNANHIKRANIFTTNYDLFSEKAADKQKNAQFYLNDGSSGLIDRYLNIGDFHISCWHQGTHDQYRYEFPTINLIKMHGSVSWIKQDENTIKVIYPNILPEEFNLTLSENQSLEYLFRSYQLIEDDPLKMINLSIKDKNALIEFINEYKKLALVNPTKKKFEETVFQQHYYQALRLLSYELEKPQTVLICFGFSFNDEHITEIIKRSLTNPTLKVFIFCYEISTKKQIA